MDREILIKELKDIQKHLDTGYSFAISWKSELIRDAIELLQEQKQKIDVLEDQNARLIRQKEARFQPVRCKDCFHKLLVDGKYYCDKPGENSIRLKDPNWYCADGIPKKET